MYTPTDEVTTAEQGSQTRDPLRLVPTRRISFSGELENMPKHFAADENLVISHLVASLSAVFPEGEEFFVRSVRHYRDQITDPALKRQVAGFIGQESIHGREHREFNEHLDSLGYPQRRRDRLTAASLAFRERKLPAMWNLALTAALEHFTATLAEFLLSSDEENRRLLGHPAARDLLVWHALEESEHKAVAFDVYRAVGGGERLRVRTMQFARFSLIFFTAIEVIVGLLTDRETYRRGRLRSSWRQFKASPVMDRAMWRQLKEYDKADFHPDDHDTTELVDSWREKLFGESGTMNSLLAGSASSQPEPVAQAS